MREVKLHWMGCAIENGTMQMGPKVALGVTFHDLMAKIQLEGASRHHLWQKYLEICYQR